MKLPPRAGAGWWQKEDWVPAWEFPLGEAEESAPTEGDRTQLDKDKVLREGRQEAQLKSVPITPLSIISQLFFSFLAVYEVFSHT